jgi:hypothetical protein
MKAFMSTFIVLAACAAHSNPATHGGGGSGSDEEGVDAGIGSGSGSDVSPPPPGTLYGTVLDERGDSIDFSTGEPVHTHAGPAIDLGASGGTNGCPAVYKYAYLEDASDPTFGRQTTTNPLAWHVTSAVGSLDDSATAYRVRALDGTVLLDWTSTSPDGNGLYTVELHRNGTPSMPALGDHTGLMYIDVRFRDTLGNETVDSACWENHPLAAPLVVTAAKQAGLFQWNLPSNSPISVALNPASITAGTGAGADYSTQEIIQYAAEPVTITLSHGLIAGSASNTSVALYTPASTTTVDIDCRTSPTECINTLGNYAPVATSVSGPLVATWSMRIVDETGLTIVCHNQDASPQHPASVEDIDGCTVPARAANAAPHKYSLVLAMSTATSIAPPMGSGPYGEFTMTALDYTGSPPDAYGVQECTSRTGPFCTVRTFYQHVVALDKAHIDFNSIALALQTQPDSTAALEPVGSYTAPGLTIPAQSWDAGDKALAP